MATLSLKISLEGGRVTKTIQFDPQTSIFDACKIIRDKFAEAVQGQPSEYGLFLSDEDNKQGVWLESGRNLGYYLLRNHDVLEYRRKLRTLRVRMLDGAVKTILVDDSQPVSQLMVVICTKIGITNHEEYGLVREETDQQNENISDNRTNFGTLTLRRRFAEKERDAKMESLRKKLKTDDEINWIEVGKTLREQGIDESETVLLRRKFFYSDQNIDSRDPVQLNLLYVQARDAILDGTHPVTQDKACEFAGIQVHIQFGDYNEQKHKPGFLDMKEFLPQSYAREKNIEKKIFNKHRQHVGVSEIDAKVLYTKTARELPTYGVTFFLVKEKMHGKNKLVPRLLGVTKDSVLRLDEHTKEILKTWPLTTVRRWGASPNTFTLDFGDYADQYYSVQTTEAEHIVQLIGGYIDIILKKKQSKDHFGIEGDEGSTMVEESVAPSKATFLQHETSKIGKVNTESLAKPVIMRGSDGERSYTHGDVQSVQYGAIVGQVNLAHQPPMVKEIRVSSVLTEPQRALLGYITAGQEALSRAEEDLMTKAAIPDLGSDAQSIQWRENTLDTSKQAVTTHIAQMNAATAQVVTASQPDEIDHEAVGAAVSQIAQSIPEVTKEVRLIAALMEDDNNGDKLLETARKLCNALSDLLKAAEPESKEPRQNLLNAASRVGEASGQVLSTIGEETPENRELYDMLLALAKAVANATAALVLRAKSVAAECEDEDMRNKVIGAASQCALATSQLVACAKVVAPTIQNAACRAQLEAAAREVAKAVTNLVEICNLATDNQQIKGDLMNAAREVSRTLTGLLEHIKLTSRERAVRSTEDQSPVESVLVATDLLVSSSDPQEMVRQARALGQATAHLIQSIKGEAEQQKDSDLQRRLLAAAKQLADATARMVEAARLCASSPHEQTHQEALRVAAEELRDITTTKANTPAMKRKLINRLEYYAKQAASAATQCISASQNAADYSDDRQTKEQLLQDCRSAADMIPRLVAGVKTSLQQPDDASAQLGLIESSEQFIEPGTNVASSARAFYPTVADHTASQQLSRCALNLSQSLHELGSAAARAREACGGQELESALDAIANLRNVLNDTRVASQKGHLRPLPGETPDNTSGELMKSAKMVGIAMSQLLSAVSQGERLYAGTAGRDTALALGELTKSVRGVTATGGNPDIIDCADDVIISSMRLVEEAQRTLQNMGDSQTLTYTARDVTQSLQKCVECLPGQREVDDALKTVSELSEVVNLGEYPPTDKSYTQLQNELKIAAENLNQVGGEVAQAYGNPAWLATVSQNYSVVYKDLLTAALEMAGQTQDGTAQTNMINGLRGVSATSVSLLSTAKSIAADPKQPNAKNQLSTASRNVTESINYLVDVCTQAAPGQKECDNAIRSIEALRPMLDYPQEPLTDQGYYDCVETATEKSRSLGYAISGMINNAKQSQHTEFGHSVNQVSESIRGLIESASQAAYLIGVSHPTSLSGRAGIIDQSQLARAYQGIRQNCDIVSSANTTKQQKITALTVIAKHTSFLCTVCRRASLNTANPVAKNEFIEGAKLVANTTADLVQEVKGLEDEYSAPSRAKFVEPLLDAVNSLCQYASSPEFISIPAKISGEGRQAQEPILNAGRGVLDGVIEMVKAAKSLAVAPEDPPVWQQLALHSKPVSESVKKLVDSIRDKAPGQAQCDNVMDTLGNCAREIDSASMSIGVQGLPKRTDNNLQGFTGQILNSSAELLDKLEPIKSAGKRNAESLGHSVGEIARYIVPMTSASIGASSHVVHSSQQMVLLDQMKSVIESARELVQVAKESGGNPRATHLHQRLDDGVENIREAIVELNATVEKLSTESGVVTGLMEQISRSMSRIMDKRQSLMGNSMSDTFVDYQTRMVQSAKEIARIANEMNARAASDPSRLAQLSVDICHHYTQLAQDAVGASYTTTSPECAMRIRQSVQDLGRSITALIQSGAGLRAFDTNGQADIARGARDVSEKVSQILASLQASSRGTQACINASSTVSGIIGDLDTTIMFATAGTLHSDGDGSFADHREHILKTAKALVEDTKVLVAGAAGTQDQLAAAAQNAVTTILQLADAVKRGASSLGSTQPESQVMVINAVKDVAAALGELINATKVASGKPIHDPSMQDLKESARVMVLNVSSLLKTVKAVEDEHTRGTRAMEATVEAISQEIRIMQSHIAPAGPPSTPEDLIRVTKNVTLATAKAVAAGTSNLQIDIVAAANLGRRAISEMLTVCRSVAWCCADTPDLRQRTLDAGASVAISYRDLLQGVLKGCSADERMHLSRRVAKCVTDLVAMAQLLKGADWIDPEDPTVIAENELLGAAASIDAAAKKLANLRPRRQTDIKEADSNMQFDEMILEAARGIMAASSALVRAANAAQRELIDQGKVSRIPLSSSDDGQWSEGLISAARLVAAATHSLVEAAQNLVLGVGTEEMLISSAKQVAASTAQLLIACKVKADSNSEMGRRLQTAGNEVIRSTDNLVRAAQQAIDMEEEHILKINTSMVDGMAQEINARSEVLKMEKQLEEARNKLVAIRQAKYKQKVAAGMTGTDESGGESDGGGFYQSQNPHYYQNYQTGFQTPPGSYQQQQQQPQSSTLNRSYNATPTSPTFQNNVTHQQQQQPRQISPPQQHQQQQQQQPQQQQSSITNRSNLFTANSVPKPYQSNSDTSPVGGSPLLLHRTLNTSSSGGGSMGATTGQSPILQRSFNTTLSSSQSTTNSDQQQQQQNQNSLNRTGKINPNNPQLEACIQDLHEKTFGKTGVLPMSTFKTYSTTTTSTSNNNLDGQSPQQNGQNYEGYTRFETKTFKTNVESGSGGGGGTNNNNINNNSVLVTSVGCIPSGFNQEFSSKLTMTDSDLASGNLSAVIDSSGSTRLAEMTQRVMERKTVTTSSETHTEKKTQQHTFHLE